MERQQDAMDDKRNVSDAGIDGTRSRTSTGSKPKISKAPKGDLSDVDVSHPFRDRDTALAFRDLILRAHAGDVAAAASLRPIFAANPEIANRFKKSSSGRSAADALLDLACENDLLARELWEHERRQLVADLSGPSPSASELLVIENIALCHQEYQYYMRSYSLSAKGGKINMATETALQRRIDRAHRRYLSAIKMLAQIRRLSLPQTNISAIQLNMGTASTTLPMPQDPMEQVSDEVNLSVDYDVPTVEGTIISEG